MAFQKMAVHRAPSNPAPAAIGTRHPEAALLREFPLVYRMPVPGMDMLEYVRPFDRTPVRKPPAPTEYPTPDLLRLTRKGPRFIDFRNDHPMSARSSFQARRETQFSPQRGRRGPAHALLATIRRVSSSSHRDAISQMIPEMMMEPPTRRNAVFMLPDLSEM